MKKLFTRFANDESGVTAIDYGSVAAGVGISVAIIAAVTAFGTALSSIFTAVTSQLASAGK
jgi:pilus assembly protein Flp/PilA